MKWMLLALALLLSACTSQNTLFESPYNEANVEYGDCPVRYAYLGKKCGAMTISNIDPTGEIDDKGNEEGIVSFTGSVVVLVDYINRGNNPGYMEPGGICFVEKPWTHLLPGTGFLCLTGSSPEDPVLLAAKKSFPDQTSGTAIIRVKKLIRITSFDMETIDRAVIEVISVTPEAKYTPSSE